jgi:hypothetical protein
LEVMKTAIAKSVHENVSLEVGLGVWCLVAAIGISVVGIVLEMVVFKNRYRPANPKTVG